MDELPIKEYIKKNYVSKTRIKELYEEYKSTGYQEVEYVLKELLEE